MSENFYEKNQDLNFIVDECLDWNSFVPKFELDFKDAKDYEENQEEEKQALAPNNTEEALDVYLEAFGQYGELCHKEIAPISAKTDKEGLTFEKGKVSFPKEIVKIIDIMSKADLLGSAIGREYGGLGFPVTPNIIISQLLAEADASFAVTFGCFNIPEVIEKYANQDIKDKYLKEVTSGRFISAMALTEPDYGSDLSHIQTKAVKTDSEGIYEITGTKRYITHGCGLEGRPSLILTLARNHSSGAKGLSFFLVDSNDVEVGGIEEKVGLHTSPTCEIIYDKSKAILIGEEGRGLVQYAMEMMNGARLMVAAQSIGIATAAYEEATKYASERIQFGQTIQKIPAVKRILDEAEAAIHAMRATAFQTCEIVDRLEAEKKFMLHQDIDVKEVRKDKEVKRLDKIAKLLTPVSKYFCSEKANQVVYDCAQVFGGAAFIEDYPIAQLYRDVRITTIYEGTSQLQVIGAIGNIVEGMHDNSILDHYLNEKINGIKDNLMKGELNYFKKELSDLVQIYKTKDKETKDTLACDLVDYFSVFFSLIILTIHQEIAENKNHPIFEEKKRVRKTFHRIARRVMEASKVQLSFY